eukprot:TRINITY_DN185_c0_g1_i1.p1 TRINITY_DN185_c0_g1~~TRINITY_DN185_c0_g1_i1.p1  ORF type:complete len:160 (+),score=33.62 TRINITY_DN185_c0_g1_i1:368-847(+)
MIKSLYAGTIRTMKLQKKIDFDEEIVQISLCKQIPNQYAVALKNGTVQLGQMQSERIANIPPKWYSPTTGCRFSCDNNIVGFTDSNPHTLQFQQAKSKCDDPAFQSSLPVSYTHLRAHETRHDLVCRLLLEKKKKKKNNQQKQRYTNKKKYQKIKDNIK